MSDYDCVCDYDPPEFYSEKTRHARTKHKCYECSRAINAGETYEYVSGKWDGDFSVFKTCCRCLELRAFVKQNVKCFCWAHGNMIEDAIDTAQEYHEQGNGLLFGAYRRKILIERATK